MVHTAPQANWVTSKDESREMMALWPDVVRDLTDGRHSDMPDVTRWLSKVNKEKFITKSTLICRRKLYSKKNKKILKKRKSYKKCESKNITFNGRFFFIL